MKQFKVVLFDPDGAMVWSKIINHLDSSSWKTTMYTIKKGDLGFKEYDNNFIAQHLNHVNLYEGMLTLYYDNGIYLEITRI